LPEQTARGNATIAPALLRDKLGVNEFVNEDVLAQGLSAFSPESVAIAAGKIMLRRIDELAAAKTDFAFETTLSTKSFVPRIQKMRGKGYKFKLIFLWLNDPNLALNRVAERVKRGGHFVPDETVKRRYQKGIENFFKLYQPIADGWRFYDNSNLSELKLIAEGNLQKTKRILHPKIWRDLKEQYAKAE
jgi:predicted ABC-type ATPase